MNNENTLKAAEKALKTGDYDRAEALANEIVVGTESPFGEDNVNVASALRILGNASRLRANFSRSLEYLHGALQHSEKAGDKEGKAKALSSIGAVYLTLWDNENALHYYTSALAIDEEMANRRGIADCIGSLGVIALNLADYTKASEHFHQALDIAEELGDTAGMTNHLGNIGTVYHYNSNFASALEYYAKALAISEEQGYKARIANHTGNMGSVYQSLSDYTRALEFFAKALTIDEELGDKEGSARWLGNIGLVYANLSDNVLALEYYSKALAITEEVGNRASTAIWLGNIGVVYGTLLDYAQSLEYHHKALLLAEQLSNKESMVRHLSNIGGMYSLLGEYEKGLEYMLRALKMTDDVGLRSEAGEIIGCIGELYASAGFEHRDELKAEKYLLESISISKELQTKNYNVHKELSQLYKSQGRLAEAIEHLETFHTLKDEVQSEEAQRSAARMEQSKQIAEQEKSYALAKAAADAKHQATQELLHNVLPPIIANRMLEGEKLIAEKLTNVSVLFADIVNFTKLSQSISAEELVEGLDTIFSSFDTLAEKYGVEKIKTIGDAYMVVCGAPEPRTDHAEAMAQFALEIVGVMKEFTSKTTGEQVQLRIGIHSGEVVAGVIGKKKFQYDLWGDAVNTASRMESHGEAGRIHVSEEFALALQTSPQPSPSGEQAEAQTIEKALPTGEGLGGVSFLPRGEIDIKGKGLMRTYFLERTN